MHLPKLHQFKPVTEKFRELFPIPFNQISLNPNLHRIQDIKIFRSLIFMEAKNFLGFFFHMLDKFWSSLKKTEKNNEAGIIS